MVDLLDKSPLIDAREPLSFGALKGNGLHLSERPRQGLLRLRGNATKVQTALRAVLGVGLPAKPNSFAKSGDREVIWLGPKKWLIHCPLSSVADIRTDLANGLEGVACQLTDVSHQHVVLSLSGTQVNALVQRCCSIDVEGPDFVPGSAVQTLFGQVPVLLQHAGDGPDYSIYVDQSLARFTWNWLSRFMIGQHPLTY